MNCMLANYALVDAVREWVRLLKELRLLDGEMRQASSDDDFAAFVAAEQQFKAYGTALLQALPSETFDMQVHEVVEAAIETARQAGKPSRALLKTLEGLLEQVREQEAAIESAVATFEPNSARVGAAA